MPSNLPPYSNFPLDSKAHLVGHHGPHGHITVPRAQSHGNILTFIPPGFKQSLNVKFPDSRLAVCDKCKKNFKTRDMCRVRNHHTTVPWSTAYICITVEDSCLDEAGKYVDKPLTVRMTTWRPWCAKKPFDSKTPVCSSCKKTNRTRSYCRERHKHRHLPWCTVYVVLSPLEGIDPSTIVASPSKKIEAIEDQENTLAVEEDSKPKAIEEQELSTPGSGDASGGDVDLVEKIDADSEDINAIPESRTFLVKVSSKGSSLQWLEEGEEAQVDPNFVVTPSPQDGQHHYGDPSHYYPPPMAYAAHHNNLMYKQQLFFQMQQQQQAQYAPPPQWPYPPPTAHGDPNQMAGTAGADAAGSKRGPQDEGYQALQENQWALYNTYAGQAGYPQDSTGLQPDLNHNPDHHHYPAVEAIGEANEDVEIKRQRTA